MSDFLFPPAAPVAAPIRGRAERFPIRRIFCVGRNYEAHAKEMGVAADREAPFYFTKAAEHYAPSGSTVPYPPGTSSYHYEMELVVAIGTAGFRVSEAEGARPRLRLRLRPRHDPPRSSVGGERKAAAVGHRARTSNSQRCSARSRRRPRLATSIVGGSSSASTARRASPPTCRSSSTASPRSSRTCRRYYHLQPGDLIYTGTPEGVGPVKPGDRLEGSIEGVGTIALQLGAPA